jgi:PAS domain S-box-containing protein
VPCKKKERRRPAVKRIAILHPIPGYPIIKIMDIRSPVGVFFVFFLFLPLMMLPAQSARFDGEVRIGVFPAAPVSFIDEGGEIRGLAPDTLRAAFEANDIPWTIRQYPNFSAAVEAIGNREIDILGGLIKTSEREAVFQFNSEPFVVSWGQVYALPERSISSLFDLRNLRIGLMVGGQNGLNFRRTMEEFDIPFEAIMYESHAAITEGIVAGEVDAGIFYNIYFLNESRIAPMDVVFSPSAAYFITDPGNIPGILETVDEWLAEQKSRDGSEYGKILQTYLSSDRVTVLPPWLRSALIISAAGFAAALSFILLLRFRIARLRQNIRADEARYSVMFNASGNGVLLLRHGEDDGLYIEDINKRAFAMLGIPEQDRDSSIEKNVLPYFRPQEQFLQFLRDPSRAPEGLRVTTYIDPPSGSRIPVDVSLTPVEIARQSRYLLLLRDLTSRYEEEFRYRTIVDHLYGWEFWTDAEHNYRFVSPGVERVTGYPPEKFLNDRNFINILFHPDDLHMWIAHREGRADTRRTDRETMVFRLYHADGSIRWIEHSCVRLKDDLGNISGYRGNNHDVTERVLFEQRQQKDIDEKQLMMQEIHHRVKNNLQIIASLINIQSDQISDDRAAGYLSEMAQRVQAMGELHKRLYHGGDISQIDLKQYASDLINHLKGSYGQNSKQVKLEILSPSIYSNMDTAIPFGLILNEAVTNAFKYAFDESGGQVVIKLEQEDDSYYLVIHDSGRGFPEKTLKGDDRGLGFQIMELLTQQLDGEITFANELGAKIELNFKKVLKEEFRWRKNES